MLCTDLREDDLLARALLRFRSTPAKPLAAMRADGYQELLLAQETISAAPSFAARWLLPRLPRLEQSHPPSKVQAWRSGPPIGSCFPCMDAPGPERWPSFIGSSNRQSEMMARPEDERRLMCAPA